MRVMRCLCVWYVLTILTGGCGESVTGPQIVALHLRARGTDVPFVVGVGGNVTLEALPVAADSSRVGDAVAANWSSSDTTRATIQSDGSFHARCVGQVSVTATSRVAGRLVSGRLFVSMPTTGPQCEP